MDKTYDIAIWGATGFVGKLIALYFARTYDSDHIKLVLVARNRERLESIKQQMVDINPKYKDVAVMVADVHDQKSVDNVMRPTKVVINTVGPYNLYGQPVVDACVRFGTHYVDLTGETNWVKKMIQTYHEEAANKGILIVPMCGFDSIPSDLGTFLAVDALKKRYNEDTAMVKHTVMDLKGGVSGGTIASMLVVMDVATKEDMMNTHLLDPTPASEQIIQRDREAILPRYDPDLKTWTHMFLMASVNSRVVRRSTGYLHAEGAGYVEHMRYIENQASSSLIKALFITGIFVGFVALMMIRPLRKVIERFLPKSGSGPSEQTMKNGRYHGKFVAKSETGKTVTLDFKITKGDPGYSQTAVMISEAAMCLLHNRDQLPHTKLTRGGILTPSSAFGHVLADRLRKSGFEIREEINTTNQA